jgi:hypothetical protein
MNKKDFLILLAPLSGFLMLYFALTIPKDAFFNSRISEIRKSVSWVRYVADQDNYWQTPEETLERGAGDCEDFAMLLLQRFYEATDTKPQLVIIEGENDSNHAIIFWNSYYIEPQTGRFISDEYLDGRIVASYSYEEAWDLLNLRRQRYFDNN